MEINSPVNVAISPEQTFYQDAQAARNRPLWLLELGVDGTIRHSNMHPAAATDNGRKPLIGSNFFDLAPFLGDLSDLRKNFFGFVKSDRNRETARLSSGAVPSENDSVIVLTRSFDTSQSVREEVVLMEIRSH